MNNTALMRLAVAIVFLAALPLAACTSARPPIQTVEHVDLSRYMGRWYVIAAIPTPLGKGAHNAVETYRLNPDGTLCTWFRRRPDRFTAPVALLHSTAKVQAGSGNAEWGVQFIWPITLQYLVGWLSKDYSQVMVVRDARDYLWYMARTPQVSSSDYHAMLERAKAMGYDAGEILKIPQRWPENGSGSNRFTGDCP